LPTPKRKLALRVQRPLPITKIAGVEFGKVAERLVANFRVLVVPVVGVCTSRVQAARGGADHHFRGLS